MLFKCIKMPSITVCVLCVCVLRDEKVEPLEPPVDSKPGDRVYVDGYQHDLAGGT